MRLVVSLLSVLSVLCVAVSTSAARARLFRLSFDDSLSTALLEERFSSWGASESVGGSDPPRVDPSDIESIVSARLRDALRGALESDAVMAAEREEALSSELTQQEKEREEAERALAAEVQRRDELEQEVQEMQKRIRDIEDHKDRVRDPAPTVVHAGSFRLYFDSSVEIGIDDRRVIASALKHKYEHAGDLSCLCGTTDSTKSLLGSVLGAVNCSCVSDPPRNATEPDLHFPAVSIDIRVAGDRVHLSHVNILNVQMVTDGEHTESTPPDWNITVIARPGEDLRELASRLRDEMADMMGTDAARLDDAPQVELRQDP